MDRSSLISTVLTDFNVWDAKQAKEITNVFRRVKSKITEAQLESWVAHTKLIPDNKINYIRAICSTATYNCHSCGWTGTGSELKLFGPDNLVCPACYLPAIQLHYYASEEEIAKAKTRLDNRETQITPVLGSDSSWDIRIKYEGFMASIQKPIRATKPPYAMMKMMSSISIPLVVGLAWALLPSPCDTSSIHYELVWCGYKLRAAF